MLSLSLPRGSSHVGSVLSPYFRPWLHVLAIGALLIILSFTANAQQAGTIVGTVTDQSGAVVTNAGITVTDTDTNQSKQVTSSSSGDFVVPDLQVGHYVLRAQALASRFSSRKTLS